jgi:hypothetical protein
LIVADLTHWTFLAIDFGKERDFTTTVVVDRTCLRPGPATYTVRHMRRFPLGTSYATVLEAIGELLKRQSTQAVRELPLPLTVVFDVTGVGMGLADIIAKERWEPAPIGILVHSGYLVTQTSPTRWHVPKADIVVQLQTLSEARPTPRVLLGPRLPFVAAMVQEMRSFRARPTTRPDYTSYEAYREQGHDDLIYALALCVWWGETQPEPVGTALDMSRGLTGLQTPRTQGHLPSQRPRSERVWSEDPPEPGSLDWDADKNRGDIPPGRSPWID